AKQYAGDVCLEIVNDALQIFGGSGYMKGMEVERAYRDAKICTIYEGTNEIQRIVIAAHLIGPLAKDRSAVATKAKKAGETGDRKKTIFEGTPAEKVEQLAKALQADGYDFTVGIPLDTPISQSERVISAGKGIGAKDNMKFIELLATNMGGSVGSSRPVAESLKYLPLNRYVGMSGQKFNGNLYVACGISGAGQHLKGIKNATTIVAINSNKNARIFKNCDYGIVGDLAEILPLLIKAFDTGAPKTEAPPMKKMKRATIKKPERSYPLHICNGCGYEYDKEIGDEENDIIPGTTFDKLPEEWICPECAEDKTMFIEI
ncbi:MAG: FAD-binding protein, partial [Eubacteriales bacterium]